MPLNRNKPPKKRPGFRWEWRDGCDCENCPWGDRCIGRTWPHWAEVKEPEYETIAKATNA